MFEVIRDVFDDGIGPVVCAAGAARQRALRTQRARPRCGPAPRRALCPYSPSGTVATTSGVTHTNYPFHNTATLINRDYLGLALACDSVRVEF